MDAIRWDSKKWNKEHTRCTIVMMRGDDVIHAGEVNPCKPQDIDKFVDGAKKAIPSLNGQADDLRREILQLAKPPEQKPEKHEPTKIEEPDHRALFDAMPADAKAAAEATLADPQLIKIIVDDVGELGIAGERPLVATIYLVGVSRLRSRPCSAIIQGHTSSGKTIILDTVANLFPPESILKATQMTPQALYHLPVGALVHRFIVAGERSRREDDESAEATRALRQMISDGVLRKLIPEKDEHNQIVTVEIIQPGPVAFIETTTLSRIFDEDANRCLLLGTDERPEQTRRILAAMASGYGRLSGRAESIILKHHAMQRLLAAERADVVVPFAPALMAKFPSDRPEARRAAGHVLHFIEAVALLHLRQRDRDEHGRIVATSADYAISRSLLTGPMSRLLGGSVSDGAKRLFGKLDWAKAKGAFTVVDVDKIEAFSRRALAGWLKELAEAGYLNVNEPGRGNKPALYQIADDAPNPADDVALPTIEDVVGGNAASSIPAETGTPQPSADT